MERAKNVMTPFLAATLDRIKLSDRNAVYVIAAVAKSLGHDLSKLKLSSNSFSRVLKSENRINSLF